MGFRISIIIQIVIGFLIITATALVNHLYIKKHSAYITEANEKIIKIHTPSVIHLNNLQELLKDAVTHAEMYTGSNTETSEIYLLRKQNEFKYKFHQSDSILKAISRIWNNKKDIETYKYASAFIEDSLITAYIAMNAKQSSEKPFDIRTFKIYTDQISAKLSLLAQIQESCIKQAYTDIKSIDQQNKLFMNVSLMIIIFIILLFVIHIINAISRPIKQMKLILSDITQGKLPDRKITESGDELGEIAALFNIMSSRIRNITTFLIEIGKENFNVMFEPAGKQDELGLALLNMRNNLKKASADTRAKMLYEAEQKWISTGHAKFSDLLRVNYSSLEDLTYALLHNLIKYIDANQGGVFLINDDDKQNIFVELAACYAYERHKFIHKKMGIHEGLVGRCIQEQEYIYMNDIPKDYIKITSGLGDNPPQHLLISPIKSSNTIYGALEIASFLPIPQYQIDFIQQVCESTAATIATTKTRINTQRFLEKTQEQTDELMAQEEELRQNMEELRAIHDQYDIKEKEMLLEIETLKTELAKHKK